MMSKNKIKAAGPSGIDAETLAHLKLLDRQRRNANRNLLKRRRRKSHQ